MPRDAPPLRQRGPGAAAFDESLRIARAEGAHENEANALASLAMLDLKAGRCDASRAALESALAIRLGTKDLRGEGSTRARLGLYHDQRDVSGRRGPCAPGGRTCGAQKRPPRRRHH